MNDAELKNFLLHLREDIVCGLHSGFPPCCIKFFITKWIWNFGSKPNRRHWRNIRRLRKYNPEYIPCPNCLKNRAFVVLKRCPKNCSKKRLIKAYLKIKNPIKNIRLT